MILLWTPCRSSRSRQHSVILSTSDNSKHLLYHTRSRFFDKLLDLLKWYLQWAIRVKAKKSCLSLLGDIPVPKHNHRRTSLTGIIIALFVLCILSIVVAVIVARKWIYSKRKKTEKADFEFRDLDALSVSSVELYGKKTCFGRCGSIWSSRKAEERMPLFRDTQLYTL